MNAIPSRVTAAEFVRHFGEWQDRAAAGPIAITHHGRDRIVAMSATSYRALSQVAETAPDPRAVIGDPLISRLCEGFVAWDGDLTVVALTRIAAVCLRVTEGEALGSRLSLDPALCSHLLRTMRTGEESIVETRSPADPARWLRLRCFPYLQGVACLLRDITDDRAAEQRRREEAIMADALGAHGRIGRARLSSRGTFVEIEPALAALAGHDVAALVRTRLTDLLALERRILAAGHLEDVLNGGAARAFDTLLLTREGRPRSARIALAGGGEGATAIVTVG